MNWFNQLRTQRWAVSERKKIRKEIRNKISRSEPVQIILGAGHYQTSENNWINTDLPQFDITKESHWKYLFDKNSIDYICAEHVLEHLQLNEIKLALGFSQQFLKPEGVFRIAIPDKNNPDPLYQAGTKINGNDIGADDHKVFLNLRDIEALCQSLSFQVIPLEYYDNHGRFHFNSYDDTAGLIKRSHKNQFRYPPIPNYSSLIVDLKKK